MNLKLYHFKVALLFEVKTISTYNADKKLESLFFQRCLSIIVSFLRIEVVTLAI